MSAGTGNNHTPLNVNNLFDRYTKPQFASLGKNQAEQTHSNLPNLFLVFAVLLFVGAFSFNLTQSQTSTNTRASAISNHVPNYSDLETSPFNKVTNYPKQFNGQDIPTSIYTEAEEKYKNISSNKEVKTYILDQVHKYFIYKTVLGQTVETTSLTFNIIEQEIPKLEKQILTSHVTSTDFRYIYATFDDLPLDKEVLKKYSDKNQIKTAALEIIQKYKSKFNSEDPQIVVSQAELDKDLILLNNDADFIDIRNYTKDSNLLEKINLMDNKEKFNEFIFSQQVNTASDPYTLTFNGKAYAYLIVYPISMNTNQYNSLSDLFKQTKDQFSY